MVLLYRCCTSGMWDVVHLPTQMYMFLPVWAFPAVSAGMIKQVLHCGAQSIDADIDMRWVMAWHC